MLNSKKFSYFIKHLLTSLFIGLSVLLLIYWLWYPAPLATATGANKLILMLVLIDIIIGPLLGLIVYKEAKKSLKFDLACIVVLQLSAFVYGVWHIADGRPAWVVFNADRFELVRNNEVIHDEEVKPQYQSAAWTGPQFVAIQAAENTQKKNDDLFIEVMSGVKLSQFNARYVELGQLKPQIRRSAQPLTQLKKYNNEQHTKKALERYTTAAYYLPLISSQQDLSVLLDQHYKVIKIVNLKPW
ncbi:TfpX/TfpZ family type IV pilin accessory protein [Acinetobacter johnsonii]|uniref:TfpX/TfpZ family type IV pilin accessory protein n=1 Tax=Acinetobacter johnsonii TaxID=40214 RepID=UPI00191A397C|nr:TfpX/TfpZ family type IV pilin accessory protein [Acinetobacter johnsonii]QQT92164.1 type IV pilin accessory protein [Acinetobacter johnsonii]